MHEVAHSCALDLYLRLSTPAKARAILSFLLISACLCNRHMAWIYDCIGAHSITTIFEPFTRLRMIPKSNWSKCRAPFDRSQYEPTVLSAFVELPFRNDCTDLTVLGVWNNCLVTVAFAAVANRGSTSPSSCFAFAGIMKSGSSVMIDDTIIA